jgi:hypothetical protein
MVNFILLVFFDAGVGAVDVFILFHNQLIMFIFQ